MRLKTLLLFVSLYALTLGASAQVQLGGHVYIPSTVDSTNGFSYLSITQASGTCNLITAATSPTVPCGLYKDIYGTPTGSDGPWNGTLTILNTHNPAPLVYLPCSTPGRFWTIDDPSSSNGGTMQAYNVSTSTAYGNIVSYTSGAATILWCGVGGLEVIGSPTSNSISNIALLPSFGSLISNDPVINPWTSLTNYTPNGTTPSVSGGSLVFSGGTGGFTQSLDYTSSNNYTTTASFWTESMTFIVGTKTTSSYGVGIGIRSTESLGLLYNLALLLDTSTLGSAGNFTLYGSGGNALASSTGFTCVAGDHIKLTIVTQDYNVYAYAENLDTPGVSTSLAYTFSFQYGATNYLHNAGHFAIYNYGGTQTVTNFSVNLTTPKNATIAFIGDSKTVGQFQSSGIGYQQVQGFSYQFPNSVLYAGGGDGTQDVINNLPEIIASSPKYAILSIGRNDLCASSVPIGTVEANYSSIVSSLTSANISVYNLLLWESSCSANATLNTWIASTYPTTLIDPELQYYGSAALSPDGVHPNPLGGRIIANTITTWIQGISSLNYFAYPAPSLSILPNLGYIEGSNGSSPTPTCTVLPGAGTGATCTVSGSNTGGIVGVTPGTLPSANAQIVRVNFAGGPIALFNGCSFSPNISYSALVSNNITMSWNTTVLSIADVITAIPVGTGQIYQWSYTCNY